MSLLSFAIVERHQDMKALEEKVMNRRFRFCLTLILSLSLLSALPATAETVLGFLEGPVYFGNTGSGAVGMTGWALADSGIERVIMQVDGVDVGQARYGFVRPGVQEIYPDYEDSEGPGFLFNLNSTAFENGLHTVSAKVITNDGTEMVIGGAQELFFTNHTDMLVPFGTIERPRRHTDLLGRCNRTCDLTPTDAIYTPITGWALDLGVEIGDAGMAWAELMIDGVIYANTRRDCRFDSTLGLVSCYGLPRLDVERIFTYALDAPNAGYRFLIDVGWLISCVGLSEGLHTISVRAGDISDQVADIDEIPVNFWCAENHPSDGIYGLIESPVEGRIFTGDINLQGWAVAAEGVARVELYIDGTFIGNPDYGVDNRPGVANQYPGFPNVAAPVWRMTYDSTQLVDGVRQIEAFVVDLLGNRTSIGERTFNVLNP